MSPLRRFFNFTNISILLVFGIFFNLGYIAYLAWWPQPVIEVHNNPFPIVNHQPIIAGDVLEYKTDYCRFANTPTEVNRTLIGPTIITLAQYTATTDVKCAKTTVKNTIIPDYAPTGTYHLKINICNKVNPLHIECQELQTQDFQIVAKPNN